MTQTLVYLAFGEGPHVAETVFSILSALRFDEAFPRVVIYTDQPTAFADLPVEVHKIGRSEFAAWDGPNAYLYRRKTCTLIDAVERFTSPVIFLDSDTWFVRSPKLLFSRLAPGRSLMHLRESRLPFSTNVLKKQFARSLRSVIYPDRSGTPVPFPRRPIVWNSGVVGVVPKDIDALHDALDLIDKMQGDFPDAHDIEQFATGIALERLTKVQEAADVVYHYWPKHLRDPFTAIVTTLIAETAGLDPVVRGRRLFACRPQDRWPRRIKGMVRDTMFHLRVPTSSRCSS